MQQSPLKLKNGQQIKSNLDSIYIGQTQNFTFFYIRKDLLTLIIPNSDIEYRLLKGPLY
jgi:hypothetical protein